MREYYSKLFDETVILVDQIERGMDYKGLIPYTSKDISVMRRGMSDTEKLFIHEIKKQFPGAHITHAWPNHSFYEDKECQSLKKEKEPQKTTREKETATSSMFDHPLPKDLKKQLERIQGKTSKASTKVVSSQGSSKTTAKKSKKEFKDHLFK
jgi:hypothetical protein